MARRRDYSNTPLYGARLNRMRDVAICEWLDAAIEEDKAQGGSGFPDVLRYLVDYRMSGRRPKPLAPEVRLERLLVKLLNDKFGELETLLQSRPVIIASDGGQQHQHFTAQDVSGLIADDDIQSLLDELNGEFGD